jgi:hypothetical protein
VVYNVAMKIKEQDMAAHVREIERCNQRGGRFLSLVDLLEADTVDLEVAGYLGAAVLEGNSFLVGAVPGGGGKTTVMGALLNFTPPGVELRAATPGAPFAHLQKREPRRCLICHEIGRGPYFAYLWGADIQDFFRLADAGHMGATNLHADDIYQARQIICEGCGVPEKDFAAWPLFIFLELEGRYWSAAQRRVSTIWEGPDRLVYRYADGVWEQPNQPELGNLADRRQVRLLLHELSGRGQRNLEDVRRKVLERFS